MNFYVSVSQLIQAVESLEKNLEHLAERAFRVSPRDSRANRDLLKQCASKVKEAGRILGEDTHLSKISLRHAALLRQVFQLFFRRMILLASALSVPGAENAESPKTVQHLFTDAFRHFGLLQETLAKLAGIPLFLELEGPLEKEDGVISLFQREESYRNQILSLLDKALEVFDEEPELFDLLLRIRRDLTEAKRKLRRLPSQLSHAASKATPLSPVLSQR